MTRYEKKKKNEEEESIDSASNKRRHKMCECDANECATENCVWSRAAVAIAEVGNLFRCNEITKKAFAQMMGKKKSKLGLDFNTETKINEYDRWILFNRSCRRKTD